MDITKVRIPRERSNSASSEETSDMEPAILDDLSDFDRRCDELGYDETMNMEATVDINNTKETFDKILDRLTEVIDKHKTRTEEGLLEGAASELLPSHRDHVDDSARELPLTQGASPRGSVPQKDQITELPPATKDQITPPHGTSTPVLQASCLQNRSAQTTDVHEKTKGATIPTKMTRDSTTLTNAAKAGLLLAGPSSPGTAPKTSPATQEQSTTQQDVLSTINCNEVTPFNTGQPDTVTNEGGCLIKSRALDLT